MTCAMRHKMFPIRKGLCLDRRACIRPEGTIADIGRSLNDTPGEFPGVLQLNDEGIHDACFYV